jgi:beta-1,4-mannosyltransferase
MAAPLVWVVVLGDFGRSPRMQYHTLSLAEAGYRVAVLASPGSPPIAPLRGAPGVSLHYLPDPPPFVARLPGVAALAAKAALQAAAMLWAALFALPRPAAILMQNPPAIPVMAVLWLAALRHRATLLIDWHNLAFSVLALKHGSRRWLIGLARGYEKALGRRAGGHFTVTKAMQAYLRRAFGVDASVLYDRPPDAFAPLAGRPRHDVLQRLGPALRAAAVGADVFRSGGSGGGSSGSGSGSGDDSGGEAAGAPGSPLTRAARRRAAAAEQQQRRQQGGGGGGTDNPFTVADASAPGGVRDARRPPALVISSTSWTPDEDFGILLEAARAYDAAASDGPEAEAEYPDVLFAITGRGPQREEYLRRIAGLRLKRCAFASVWLEPEDYPALLGAADLGVCLHTSSSGLDLPMKVGGGRGRVGVWGAWPPRAGGARRRGAAGRGGAGAGVPGGLGPALAHARAQDPRQARSAPDWGPAYQPFMTPKLPPGAPPRRSSTCLGRACRCAQCATNASTSWSTTAARACCSTARPSSRSSCCACCAASAAAAAAAGPRAAASSGACARPSCARTAGGDGAATGRTSRRPSSRRRAAASPRARRARTRRRSRACGPAAAAASAHSSNDGLDPLGRCVRGGGGGQAGAVAVAGSPSGGFGARPEPAALALPAVPCLRRSGAWGGRQGMERAGLGGRRPRQRAKQHVRTRAHSPVPSGSSTRPTTHSSHLDAPTAPFPSIPAPRAQPPCSSAPRPPRSTSRLVCRGASFTMSSTAALDAAPGPSPAGFGAELPPAATLADQVRACP